MQTITHVVIETLALLISTQFFLSNWTLGKDNMRHKKYFDKT